MREPRRAEEAGDKQMENPWTALPKVPPYVLPCDAEAVETFNRDSSRKDEHRIQTHLLPEPFIGCPNAPILVLGKNPGYKAGRAESIRGEAVHQARMRDNLLHKPSDYPFMKLDPSLPGCATDWWKKKFKKRLSQPDALDWLAKSLLAVELLPYASTKFRHGKLVIPSQEYSFWLVREAMRRKAVIVITRGVKL
jgi:hypothetical protein